MNELREFIRWLWLVVALADFLAAGMAWLELRKKRESTFKYLGRILFSNMLRSLTAVVGLYLFGVNVQAHLWFVVTGLGVMVIQAVSTVGWLLFVRGIINGGGFLGLILGMFRRHPPTSGV